jgi:DNA-binding NarL/FixJ family response regulator
VADGLSNDEIGRSLGITSKSVEAHISRIFARTGVRSRTELATTAIRQGWLDLPGRVG